MHTCPCNYVFGVYLGVHEWEREPRANGEGCIMYYTVAFAFEANGILNGYTGGDGLPGCLNDE